MLNRGDILIIRVNSVAIGALVSNQLGITADMLNKTTKDSGGHKEYSPGHRGYTVSVSSLYNPISTQGFSEAIGYLKAGTVLTIFFGDPNSVYWTGEALIKKANASGERNKLSEYELDMLGISDLEPFVSDGILIAGEDGTLIAGEDGTVIAGGAEEKDPITGEDGVKIAGEDGKIITGE